MRVSLDYSLRGISSRLVSVFLDVDFLDSIPSTLVRPLPVVWFARIILLPK